MGKDTAISWCDATFNLAWGCQKVSPGCAHCYAETLSTRYGHRVWGPGADRRTFGEKHWREPLLWDAAAMREGRRARVFASSMCDVGEDHPVIAQERRKLWSLIRLTPHLDWLLLTKRDWVPVLPDDWGGGYPNVWLGVSVEDQQRAEERIPRLVEVPAVVRFVSVEPLLGPISASLFTKEIDWVIVGAESGPGHRPMELQWARDIRDACARAGVAFFFKQQSGFRAGTNPHLDGVTHHEWPQ